MQLSTISGKPVLSASGEVLGYVTCAYIGKNYALSCLACADGEEEDFFVPAHAVLSVQDAVLAGNARLKEPSGMPCPVGKPVFDEHGTFLGRASGFDTEGVLNVSDGSAELSFPAERAVMGETVIVYSAPKKIQSKRKKRPQSKKPLPKVTEPPQTEPPQTEFESSLYALSLLGKRVQKTVAGLAKEGETVTPEIIKRARENNRLLALTASTLTD